MNADSFENLNKFIDYDIIDKLCNSIAKIIAGEARGTGFFIKLKVNSTDNSFFCTSSHTLKKEKEKILLIINRNRKPIVRDIELKRENRIILKFDDDNEDDKYDTRFIQIFDDEIENIDINYLELEESYIYNPTKFNNYQAIMAGYPQKYYNPKEDGEMPIISHGRIIKIKEEIGVVYNMETDFQSSGSPICIINDNDKLKLLAIHKRKGYNEKQIYNEGILLWSVLRKLSNQIEPAIFINVKAEFQNVENVIKNLSDKFEGLLKIEKSNENDEDNEDNKKTEIFKYNFLKIEDYNNNDIKIYHQQILEEYKNRNEERFNAYFNLLNNHILFYAHNELGEAMNKILTILRDFKDINSTYKNIKSFNNNIIDCFNIILISKDYKLKIKLIYFISIYIQTLSVMKCRYYNKNVTLYKRRIMDLSELKDLKEIEKNEKEEDRIIVFKYFINNLIPDTTFNYLYKLYYNLKNTFKIGYSKTMNYFGNSDYDTSIYIEFKGDYKNINCFKFSKWPEIVIPPFNAFRVDKVEINDMDQTAKIKLILLERNEILKEE